MPTRPVRWGALALAIALFALGRAEAATFIVPTDDSLVHRADAIVVGTPTSSYARFNEDGGIETVTTLSVSERIKGRPAQTIEIVEPGGAVGNVSMVIPGSPRFEDGVPVLLFLKQTGAARWSVADLVVGKFSFAETAAGRSVLVRDEDELIGWDPNLQTHVEQQRAAPGFLDFVRGTARGLPMRQEYFIEKSPLRRRMSDSSVSAPSTTDSTSTSTSSIVAAASAYSATSYTMDISSGKGSRWTVFPNPVTFYSGTTQEPGAPGGGSTAITHAFSSWNNDCLSNVNYVYGGTDNGTHTKGLHGADGANTILFERDLSSWGISPFTCTSTSYGGTLGLGGVTSASGSNTVNGETFVTTNEADVEMNRGIANCSLLIDRGEFDSAVTHEVGHTLGFRHADQDRASSGACSSDPSLECASTAIMKSFVTAGLNAALQPWDQHAVQAVYPGSVCQPGGSVCTPPSISTQPASKSITSGSSTTLSVTATGTGPLSYQWYVGSSGNTATPVPGGTTASITVSPSATTSYWVRVANSCGSVNSTTATVTVTSSPPPPPPPGIPFVLRRDLNKDGNADILWRVNSTGVNTAWLMNGTSRSSIVTLPSAGSSWRLEGAADFNSDGAMDLVFHNVSTGATQLWLMNGVSRLSVVSLPAKAAPWSVGATGDFDGDGDADIFWRNTSTGANAIWVMNGTAFVSEVAFQSQSTAWRLEGGGNFNSDAYTDLVWRNPSTGADVVWFVTSNAYSSTGTLPSQSGSSWNIEAIADYDKNGSFDLVWRNYSTGANRIWLMSGLSRLSTVSLPSDTNLKRLMAGPR